MIQPVELMLTKLFLNYKVILSLILMTPVLGCNLDKDNTPILGRVTSLNTNGVVEIELYNRSDHEKLTIGILGIGASTFTTQDNLKFRVEKIEEDKISLVILDDKNNIYKPSLENDIVVENPELAGKPTIIDTITNLPNNGSLTLDTNILIKEY